MEQWLQRGVSVAEEKRIKKMISASSDWQIYSTNQDTYVLAATPSLYNTWIDDYALPKGIFRSFHNCMIFCSSGNYLISSLANGPYPENNGQIEAFSIAFRTAANLSPTANLGDAVYIEEYSLILPGVQSDNIPENECIYGRWITGGANISANAFTRIVQFMSWLPVDFLKHSFELAGFNVSQVPEEESKTDSCTLISDVTGDIQQSAPLSNERFSLEGRPDLEQFFNDNIIDIILHQEQYKRMGISFPGATILHGPPGCGKTYAVEQLANFLGWKRFDIDSSTIASSFIHDTSKKIAELFHSAIKAAPSIIVIDEMEAFLSNRNMAGPSNTHHVEEVAEFLRRIPEAISNGVLVFAMTNMIETIDPAILRRGRFDHIIEVKMATKEEMLALLKVKFRELPIADDVVVENIAEKLDNHPMSDVTFVLREAGRMAVKGDIEYINQMCFDKALDLLPQQKEKRKIGFGN